MKTLNFPGALRRATAPFVAVCLLTLATPAGAAPKNGGGGGGNRNVPTRNSTGPCAQNA